MASPFPTLFDATRPMRSIDPFLDLSREMNRMMDSFFPGAGQLMGVGARMATHALPRVDVQEDEQAIVISAELPGVDIGDIDVQLEGDALTLSGEKRARSDTALERYRLMERSFGSFRRTLALPFTPDPGSVTAEHAQGVLTIRIPKTATWTKAGAFQCTPARRPPRRRRHRRKRPPSKTSPWPRKETDDDPRST